MWYMSALVRQGMYGSIGQAEILTHQKYDAVLINAYSGTMNRMRTMSASPR